MKEKEASKAARKLTPLVQSSSSQEVTDHIGIEEGSLVVQEKTKDSKLSGQEKK